MERWSGLSAPPLRCRTWLGIASWLEQAGEIATAVMAEGKQIRDANLSTNP